ncbi:MAG: ScaI family restriction endonuclease [Nostocales cyanobacterium]|nr:MAG: ScaI family restriction endonuclease [Nostocales cyanobacterium]
MVSPYSGIPVEKWADKTKELIEQHPLDVNEIYEIVMSVWEEIFESSITSRGYKIGKDIFPSPQIIGSLLHELIPLELSSKYPQVWRREQNTTEKDLVYIPDDRFSIEIKTSSSPRDFFGNRSYAQKSTTGKTKKSKSGYYLIINFEKIEKKTQQTDNLLLANPQIRLVRFGWIDQEDWQGQTSATGQQAKLSLDVKRYKLLELPLSN